MSMTRPCQVRRSLAAIGAMLLLWSLPAEEPDAPILGIWLMGQSLCDGSESLPIVTAEDTGWGNYAFRRGVRTWWAMDHSATPETRSAEQFEFVPLRAEVNGGLGETVANGLADHLKASILATKQGGERNGPPHFLVACAGQGGRQIQELAPADLSTDPRTPESRRHGGGYYRTSLDDARRAREQAEAQGRKFRIEALYWMQGEGNGGPTGGIVPTRWDVELPRPEGLAWYRDQLVAYRAQWSCDLCGITGQSGEIPLFTYQTLGPAGQAQLLAADADPSIHLVGPHYAVPSAINSRTARGRHGDAIHLSADGERWWGEQVAKVMHRVLHGKEAWQPLRPLSAELEAGRGSVLVEFFVPRPPLVVDTDFLPRQETEAGGGFSSFAGFQVRDGAGRPQLIASVEVIAPTQLRLRLVEPLSEGETCRIGYGHPAAGSLGTIAAIRQGPEREGNRREEIAIEGRFPDKLRPLTDEGAFFVMNRSPEAPARATVRHVCEEGGTTVLEYDPGELRDGTPFAVGQELVAMRPFSYGNLRDSDEAASVHAFADAAYGTRVGKSYPLWNWCILFSDLEVVEPEVN